MELILGIDVGASGVKGALVDVKTGQIQGERYRIPTPKPATPEALSNAFAAVVDFFQYRGAVGCGFPAIVKDGIAYSAANIDSSWIGVNVEASFSRACGAVVYATNDADAAGLAEMRYGAGRGEQGVVILITIGTGLGSALFYRGMLIPNTELGHLLWKKNRPAEAFCSSAARERAKISRIRWAKRFNDYLHHLERLFSPTVFILGGGESKYFDQYAQFLNPQARVVPAQLLNNAGIIGAAVYASERSSQ